MGQLLRYAGTLPDPPKKMADLDGFMVTGFIDAVRTILTNGGYKQVKDGVEQGGTFLVGVRGRLYQVGSDFQVGRARAGYDACGSGYMVALGSLFSTRHLLPAKRISTALMAACATVPTVGGKLVLEVGGAK